MVLDVRATHVKCDAHIPRLSEVLGCVDHKVHSRLMKIGKNFSSTGVSGKMHAKKAEVLDSCILAESDYPDGR